MRELKDIFKYKLLHDKRNEELSIGQRPRVQIAREFLHEMELIIYKKEPNILKTANLIISFQIGS